MDSTTDELRLVMSVDNRVGMSGLQPAPFRHSWAGGPLAGLILLSLADALSKMPGRTVGNQ